MSNSKNKLLMINGAQFGYSAGHYYYCKYLKANYHITYLCYDRGLPKMELAEVKVTYIPFHKSKIKRLYNFVKTSIKTSNDLNPKVLFVVYFNLCFIISLFSKAHKKILDIRTGSLNSNKTKRKLENLQIKLQSICFNKIIILSESLRNKIGISKKNTIILPLGAEIYTETLHNFDHLHLLYIGTFDGRNIVDTIKGLAIFLNKYPSKKQHTTYSLVGFGSDEETNKLLNCIKEEGLEKNVTYEGRKNYTELLPYFNNSNIGVSYVPITDFYNIQPPTKTYEYILNGLYTIATSTYENSLIINEINGTLCQDNAESFAQQLIYCDTKKHKLNSTEIRSTLQNHKWSYIIQEKLIPFLN